MNADARLPGEPTEPLPFSPASCVGLGIRPEQVGIVIVDHGSRRDESNRLLLEVADLFRQMSGFANVEAAHMELARPTIAEAFATVVGRGAELVIVHPYFLAPGRHWRQDIPHLAAEAARAWPGVRYLVTAPLGLHPLMIRIMQARMLHCLQRGLGQQSACSICSDNVGCQMLPTPDNG